MRYTAYKPVTNKSHYDTASIKKSAASPHANGADVVASISRRPVLSAITDVSMKPEKDLCRFLR